MQPRLFPETNKIVTNYVFSTARNVLLGAGLCFAIQNKNYTHIPLIFFFPSIYAGYHAYSNKDSIARYIIKIKQMRDL